MDIKTVTGNENWDPSTIQKMLQNEKYKGDTRLQKTYVEDVMTEKKVKNTGQVTSYHIRNSHPAIISEEIFDKVQKEMDRRSRVVYTEDGTIEKTGKRYASKFLLGSILECGYCRAAYRRRTEGGNIVWRCGTRMEKDRDMCGNSPTLKEEWIKEILAGDICEGRIYDEETVRYKVDRILVFSEYMNVYYDDKEINRIEF